MILDTQELAASRERERQLRQDIAKVQTDLDKERVKNKTVSEKVQYHSRKNQLTLLALYNKIYNCLANCIGMYCRLLEIINRSRR